MPSAFAAARAEVRAIPRRAGRAHRYMPLILRVGNIPRLTPAVLFVVIATVTGSISSWLGTPLATPLNTAYAMAIVNYLVRRQQTLLMRLRPQIQLDDAHFKYEWYALTHFRHVIIIGASVLAPIALISINWHSVGLQAMLHGNPPSPAFAWSLVLALVDWVLILQIFVIILGNAWRFHQLGMHHTRINLLDTAELTPYTLAGIAVLVLFAGAYTVVPIAALLSSRLIFEAALHTLVVSLPILLVGTLLPLLGIHHRLHMAKDAEIARINLAIHGDRAALAGTHLAAESGSVPLSNLVLYRQAVGAVSEWPIDSLGVVRAAIIVLVPVLAWIAGAVADHVMDRLLG